MCVLVSEVRSWPIELRFCVETDGVCVLVAERGIYILYEDVKSCPCEDVQILWSILVESHPPQLRLKH
jgi:hypothetical protein